MDNETRKYFDDKFEKVHTRINTFKDDIHKRDLKMENRVTSVEEKASGQVKVWASLSAAFATCASIGIIYLKKLF